MQTRRRAVKFLLALSPAMFLIVIPTFVVGRLIDPPYNLVGWAIVLTIAWLATRRRDRAKGHPGDWRENRGVRHVSGHGVSR
jgi:hypothetical protein